MRIKYLFLSGLISTGSLLILFLIFEISLAGVEASQRENSNAGWVDQFDSATLDSRWEWVREDPTHWSLTDRPGFLRIVTQEGSLYMSGTGKNILLTQPTLENYQISTKVIFTPTELAQTSGLVVYQDDDNYILLSRRYTSNDMVTFRLEAGGELLTTNVPVTATTIYLRIINFNDGYFGEYSSDGNTWIEVDKFNIRFTDSRVGITAYNGPSTLEISADYDYFQLSELGETLYVAPGGECGEVEHCYSTIQQAVDEAISFDSIKVASGIYTDLHVFPRDDETTTGVVTQVVYLSKTLTIHGGYSTVDWTTPNPAKNLTTIDAQDKGRGLYITGEVYPRIEGFHITRGNATGLGGEAHSDYDAGGGVYIWKSVTSLTGNRVEGNSAEVGGGIYINTGGWGDPYDPVGAIVENTIISNTATLSGGGFSLFGGAGLIIRNVIRYNEAGNFGGGMDFLFGSSRLYQNMISNNTCGQGGGGISFQWGYPKLVNNVIIDNHVEKTNSDKGNGLHIEGANPTMSHNTIARNTGGDDKGSGVYIVDLFEWAQPTMFMTNTILADQPVGIFANGISTLTVNGILWHNTPITITTSPTAVVSVSHQYIGNPSFASDGYHLSAGSAAIDKGSDAGISVDVDGEPRPAGAGYDLGADELWIKVYLPLVVNE